MTFLNCLWVIVNKLTSVCASVGRGHINKCYSEGCVDTSLVLNIGFSRATHVAPSATNSPQQHLLTDSYQSIIRADNLLTLSSLSCISRGRDSNLFSVLATYLVLKGMKWMKQCRYKRPIKIIRMNQITVWNELQLLIFSYLYYGQDSGIL